MINIILYNYENLNVDDRLFPMNDELKKENCDMVLVKGVVWNKGKLLKGADLDLYLKNNGVFKNYNEIPEEKRKLIQSILNDVLISPRTNDFESRSRSEIYYVDAEMALGNEYASLEFVNPASKTFFETGYLEYPDDFDINIHLVRFILNRFLEKNGSHRRLSTKNYESVMKFAKNLPHGLYKDILSSFSMKDGLYSPPTSLPYMELVSRHASDKLKKEDIIYIKPLNAAYKELSLQGFKLAVDGL